MKEVMQRLLLIKGPIWHRVYLLVFYFLLFDYLTIFLTFFSLPPGHGSAMSDRMDRALMLPAIFLLPLNVAGLIIWLSAGIAAMVKSIRGTATEIWGLSYALLPIIGYLVLSRVYGAFLDGHGAAMHNFLYHLPERF